MSTEKLVEIEPRSLDCRSSMLCTTPSLVILVLNVMITTLHKETLFEHLTA